MPLLSAKKKEIEATIHTGAKISQQNSGERLPRMMSLDFCCIQIVGSEFGMNNIKVWIHPNLFQRSRLVGDDVKVLVVLHPVLPAEYPLNSTA